MVISGFLQVFLCGIFQKLDSIGILFFIRSTVLHFHLLILITLPSQILKKVYF